jgi:hypothetical protein
VRVLKNYPWEHEHLAEQPIILREGEPGWDEAYRRWQAGKKPNPDPRWDNVAGVFLSIGVPS